MIQTANINAVWASLMMEKLVRYGITRVVLSPGSRSTPLAVAAARNEALTTTMHFDERAAAFYALGLARALRQPVALACTSGSAVANYLPAVVEAAMDEVPLLLLTADRPPELHDCGANQTIPQGGMFGRFVRHELDLACPDSEIPAHEYLRQLDRAVVHLSGRNCGPVHINCPYREPLAPDEDGVDYSDYLAGIEQPLARPTLPKVRCDDLPTELFDYVRTAKRGVIVVGKLDRDEDRVAVLQLADCLGWPVLPDIQSGLRIGSDRPNVIGHVDQVLLSKSAGENLRADFVLHIGGRLLSKRLLSWLDDASIAHYVRLTPSEIPFDPNHRAPLTLVTDIPSACVRLADHGCERANVAWPDRWQRLNGMVGREIGRHLLDVDGQPADPRVAAHLLQSLTTRPDPPTLWSASSLPIRLLDMYAPTSGSPVTVISNRGASGIDGTIASAAGYADASGRPLVLLIGDLAFLHDLTSLDLIRRANVPVTIVLLNNNGGNIFGLLPIAEHHDVFVDHFLTPHGHTFEHAIRQFGLPYHRCESMVTFDQLFADAVQSGASSVIEVTIQSGSGTALMRRMANDIRTALDAADYST